MAIDVRKGSVAVERALVAGYNGLLQKVTSVLTTDPHADVTSTTSGDATSPVATPYLVTAANATDLASGIALANDILLKFNVHAADALAHKTADGTNAPVTTAQASDLTTLEALLNSLKTHYNAHLAQATVHYTNDGTNAVATANATDLATSEALANALKTAFNAHIQFALGASAIHLIEA